MEGIEIVGVVGFVGIGIVVVGVVGVLEGGVAEGGFEVEEGEGEAVGVEEGFSLIGD